MSMTGKSEEDKALEEASKKMNDASADIIKRHKKAMEEIEDMDEEDIPNGCQADGFDRIGWQRSIKKNNEDKEDDSE
jgi:hypothetical protein